MVTIRRLAWLLALLATVASAADADTCDYEGSIVLTAGSDDTEALVVAANCSETTIDVDSKGKLTASSMEIQKVVSAPDIKTIYLALNNISSLTLSDLTALESLYVANRRTLTSNVFTSFSDLAVPDSITSLDLSWNSLDSFDGMSLPDSMKQLYLGGNKFTSLADVTFPSSLTLLYVHDLPLSTLDGASFPDTIQYLSLVNSQLSSLEGVSFPDNMEYLYVNSRRNPIETVQGVSFPWDLTKLDLGSHEITTFEISRSDYSTFKDLTTFTATVTQTSCSTSSAELVTVSDLSICVISDDLFASTYGSTASASSSSSQSATTTAESDSGGTSTILIVVICLAAVLAVALAAFAFRSYRTRQNKANAPTTLADTNNFFANNTLITTASHSGGNHNNNSHHNSNSNYSFNTIFSGGKVTMMGGTAIESALVKYRVPATEVQIERSIAKGGFGIVFLAVYQGRPIVVKKILPEKATDDRCLSAFIDEIKLSSTLSHAKIVRFIGVSWSMLSDMAVLMEYMPNGDLDMLLKQQHKRQEEFPNEFDWYQNSAVLPAKATLALDVLEAIVYLHSFPSPIIHRDLKSKNVLLSATYEAKLSDFGISREWQVDATMTAGIGTMAWIAPEVLRGERYTEMADIYSFGVILSELATCIKPFEGVTNALIVLKVTSEEKPDLGTTCPEDIRELADRCLSYNASDRPSASVAHYELRTLLKLHTAFEL
ncbi:hypothetical protein BBJ28_00010831 [Nothophytophthora sp. Chile5]|nr:hypothetical protein BBJ28_00010831 [Nothophytophthora sp. Chile5]